MAHTAALWFRRTYLLPPLDPRFLGMTPEDVSAEMWAHYYDDAKPGDEVETDDFEAEVDRLLDSGGDADGPSDWEEL